MSDSPLWATQTDASTDTDSQFVGGLVDTVKGWFGQKKQAPCPTPDKKAMKHIIEKKTQHRLKKGKKVANKA